MRYALSADLLQSGIIYDKEAELIPLYLCATVGTISSDAVDPFGPLCNVEENYSIWVHIDTAYARSPFRQFPRDMAKKKLSFSKVEGGGGKRERQ